MKKYLLHRIVLLLAAMMAGVLVFAQTTAISDYNVLPGDINLPVGSGSVVCPSLDSDVFPDVSSTSIFRVKAYDATDTDIGAPELNTFEWVVYGGWITQINGVDIVTAAHPYSRLETASGENRYSYITVTGVADDALDPLLWEANITVEWDTTNFSTLSGWVAVFHTSEWSCTDNYWSVYENDIINTPPTFDNDPLLPELVLPYQLRESYVLPLPAASDEGCNQPLSYSYRIEHPTWGSTSGTYIEGDDASLTVNLETGANLVSWTVSDGSRTVKDTYTITVEPPLEILHVAWTQPSCDGDNDGVLRITGVTDYVFLSDVEYSFNGGAYSTTSTISGLSAGDHTVQAKVVYDIDSDNNPLTVESYEQLSEVYTATLAAQGAASVTAPLPDATITDAGCLSSSDGAITVDTDLISELNNAVSFDGDDYLLLNKAYDDQSLGAFTIATWIKLSSAGNTEGTLISFDNGRYFELGLDYYPISNSARVRFRTNSEEGPFFHTTPVNDDQWHLVVAVFNNGDRTIYIDGEAQFLDGNAPTVGGNGYTRYGMIGARLSSSTFSDVPQAPFFSGQMAEMALWEASALTSDQVQTMLKSGVHSMAPQEHWVLNSVPLEVSATQTDVFSDLGNRSNSSAWGRFYNGALAPGTSPKLFSWTDNLGGGIADYPAEASIDELGVGEYTLYVNDIFGCGAVSRTYSIENSDAAPPQLYWNTALYKTATQSSTDGSNFASLAVDGLGASNPAASSSLTNNDNEAWWEVDLGGVYPLRMIHLHTASALSNFWVIASQTPFAPASTLANDLALSGVSSVEFTGSASGSTPILLSANARYVRIRSVGSAALHLAEVEVLTNQAPAAARVLFLSPDNTLCYYSISDDEFSIAPYAYDVCNGITSFEHNAVHSSLTNLISYDLPLGDTEITWTATDDAGLVSPLAITYRVIDQTDPVMDPLPFGNETSTITYCASLSYSLVVPKVDDNYPLTCGDLQALELYSGAFSAYQYPDLSVYNPLNNENTGNIDVDYLAPGDHVLEWRVSDFSGNQTTDQLSLHVEKQPRVLEIKTSPITCNNANDAVVTFSRIESEQDVNTAVNVNYILEHTVTAVQLPQTDNPVFSPVPEGTYRAFIEVNGCTSDDYYENIVVSNPGTISVETAITPVACAGWADGGIALTVSGGSQTNILHFTGTDNLGASAANYAGIDLAGSGSLEGWIYLDELGALAGESNYNTALFGVNNALNEGYGFKIIDGILTFYTGANAVAAPAGSISERSWIHIAGTWSEPDQTLNLAVNGSTVATVALPSGFSAPIGGDLFFGFLPGGDATNALHGFVRNVRIWSTIRIDSELLASRYLLDPIDAAGSLEANYPLAAGGGTVLQNRVPGGNSGSINSAGYAWQKFAYYWQDSKGDYVARTRDIADVVADDYTLFIDDPLGCSVSNNYTITIDDSYRPTMTFSNNGHNIEPFLTVGEPIRRFTSDLNAEDPSDPNRVGDCVFYPFSQEFDPYIEDDICPADEVEVSYTVVSGTFADGTGSLDGLAMSDVIRLSWTATDQAGNSRTEEINYYIIDDEAPVLTWSNQTRANTPGDCGYTVTAGDVLLGLVYSDNCTTGRLYNNINGSNSLEGAYFGVGTHTVRWTYEDKNYPGSYDTPNVVFEEVTLTVEDTEVPAAVCMPAFTVELDAAGSYTINADDVDNGSGDNCGDLANIHLTKNVAYAVGSASQSGTDATVCAGSDTGTADKAIDGNSSSLFADCSSTLTPATDYPWWEVDLGALHTLYGVNVYSSDAATLGGFWLLVSNNGTFSNSGDWTNPVFSADVIHAEYFDGTVNPSQLFAFEEAVSGQYVRIVLNATAAQLCLAEVEVFGTTNAAAASSLTLSCDDIRYTPNANPLLQGTFHPMGLLLTAIDDNGNTHSCRTEVTVEDQTAPVVQTQIAALEVSAAGGGAIVLDPMAIDDGSTDNCQIFAYSVSPDNFDCSYLDDGLQTVTLTVTDIYGNSSSADAYLTIVDLVPPVPDCKGNAAQIEAPVPLYLDNRGEYTVQVSDLNEASSDNCTIAYYDIADALENLDCDDLGAQSITLEVFDVAGNSATCTSEVLVVDEIAPVILAPQRTIPINNVTGEAIVTAESYRNLGTNDNCTSVANLTFKISTELVPAAGDWVDQIDFNCAGLNLINPNDTEVDYTIWIQVTDQAGNVSEEQIIVTIEKTLEIQAMGITSCDVEANQVYAVIGGDGTIANYSWDGNGDNTFWICSGSQLFRCYRNQDPWLEREHVDDADVWFNADLPVGSYTMTYWAEDTWGCEVSQNYTYNWVGSSALNNSMVLDTVCAGSSKTYYASEVIAVSPGGSSQGNPTWTWNNAGINAVSVSNGGSGDAESNKRIDIEWHNMAYGDTIELTYSYKLTIPSLNPDPVCNNYYKWSVNIRPPLDLAFEAYDNTICPLSIEQYKLVDQDMTGLPADDEFVNFTWDFTALPADASRYDGGFAGNNWTQILWGDPGTSGTLSVTVEDQRGCDGSVALPSAVSVEDLNAPVIVNCPSDEVRNNYPLSCGYTFDATELPPMTTADITDDCLDDATAPYYDFEGVRSDGLTTRNYPVGVTTVTWTVTDLAGLTASCEQSITIVDNEAPIFDAALNNVTLYADASCQREYLASDPNRAVTATDNCPASTVSYSMAVDFDNDATINETVASNNPVDIVGFFPIGISKITLTASDDAVDADGNSAPNARSTSYLVSVIDNTPPVIAALADITGNNDAGFCSADLSAVVESPQAASLSDNCTSAEDLAASAEFISRSDGLDQNDLYPVGSTTITWRVSDASENRTTATQNVIVSDVQEPWFELADAALQDASIGYCTRDAHRLPIPEPFDNCAVESISWTVSDGGAYNETGTITRALSASFDPNGDGLTGTIASLPADADTGSDYTVTWTLEDIHGNVNTLSTYSYTLHVELEPYFDKLNPTAMTCGNANDGKIAVVTSEDYRVEVDINDDPVYPVYYSIDNWETEQMDNPIFENLSGGTYSVQMRVNDCYSETRETTIEQPEVYAISLSAVHPLCYEDETGSIDLTMTGGVAGQLLFTEAGAGVAAADYDELDLTTSGSIEGWVYLESLNDATLISKGGNYALKLLGGKFTIDLDGVWLGTATTGAGLTPELYTWYYVVGTWDSAGNSMQLFVNEAGQGGTIQGTLAAATADASDLTIGAAFAGIIREVRIWDIVVDGSVPNEKYTGSEDNLVAYWPMEHGSGDIVPNKRSGKNPAATNLTGATAFWNNQQPQPGSYSWTKNAVAYSTNIDLEDLGRGIYEVSFIDPYNCPAAPGLQESITLTPTDGEQPNITNIGIPVRYVDDNGGCSYEVKSDGSDDALMPEITDDCDFTTTWRVIPERTLVPQVFTGNNLVDTGIEGAILELGINRVEVTATQYNGTITSSLFYNIEVEDNVDPVAAGQDVSDINLSNDNLPMGSGIVYYDAFGFNNNSSDNCTSKQNLEFKISDDNGANWFDELSFDCDDVGTDVQISFKVIDEARNEDVLSEGVVMTVADIHPPVFTGSARSYEACVTVDDNGEPYTFIPAGSLRLDETDYTDNCNVQTIEYSIDHATYNDGDVDWRLGDDPTANGEAFYEGSSTVSFRITDSSNNQETTVIYYINILPKPAPAGGIR